MELATLKKRTSGILFALSLPIIVSYPPFLLFGIDVLKPTGMWEVLGKYDDLALYVMIAPFVALSFSIPLYFTRDKIYKIWLRWTGVCLVLFGMNIMIYDPRSLSFGPDFGGPFFLYILGSLVLLFANAILHFLEKRRMQQV